MKRRPKYVLDASALLAYLREEPEASAVRRLMESGAEISSVNLAEVLTKLADAGTDPEQATEQMRARGVLGDCLSVRGFDEREAREAARPRPATRPHGLSPGDRASLATARHFPATPVTTDSDW